MNAGAGARLQARSWQASFRLASAATEPKPVNRQLVIRVQDSHFAKSHLLSGSLNGEAKGHRIWLRSACLTLDTCSPVKVCTDGLGLNKGQR